LQGLRRGKSETPALEFAFRRAATDDACYTAAMLGVYRDRHTTAWQLSSGPAPRGGLAGAMAQLDYRELQAIVLTPAGLVQTQAAVLELHRAVSATPWPPAP
jgi:hypothetical protein